MIRRFFIFLIPSPVVRNLDLEILANNVYWIFPLFFVLWVEKRTQMMVGQLGIAFLSILNCFKK